MRGWWGSAGGGGGRVLVVRRAMWTMGTQILRLSGTAQAAGAAGGGDRSPCHKVKALEFILTGERELNPFQSVCAGGTDECIFTFFVAKGTKNKRNRLRYGQTQKSAWM